MPQEAVRAEVDLRQRLILIWNDLPVATVGGVVVRLKAESASPEIFDFRVNSYKICNCLCNRWLIP